MENLDPNQLPMLPDPLDEPALPAGPTAAPTAVPMTSVVKAPWFRTKWFRFGLIAVGAVAVLTLVLFSRQIGQLLNLFGTKASTNQSVTLDQANFLAPGHTMSPANSFHVVNNRLMLQSLIDLQQP